MQPAGTQQPPQQRPMPMPAAQVPVRDERKSAFVPLLVLMAALAVWTGFQTLQLSHEREALATLRANQEAQVQQAQKVRQTLDQLASETQKLADGGNANARIVVEELRKRGVTINRPAQAPESK
jgi:preprotein translocase subunit SecF